MRNRGFTLIEMLVSVAIFSVVMVIALGALLSLSEANRKAELLSEATNNFNSAIDSMTRAMRTGTNFHCGGGTLTSPLACPSGSSEFAFLAATSQETVYEFQTTTCPNTLGCIMRSQDGGESFAPITSPELVVTSLQFDSRGAEGVQQPWVAILVGGYVVIQGTEQTTFNLETSVAQRLYDQ